MRQASERDPRQRWAGLLLALGAALAVARVSRWPAPLALGGALVGAVVPIQHTLLLVVAAFAACALVAWASGGRGWVALAWLALTGWMLTQPLPDAAPGYGALVRGWTLLMAGGFGIVNAFVGADVPFFTRALATIGVALTVGAGGSVAHTVAGDGPHVVLQAELVRRVDQSLTTWSARTAGPRWALATRHAPAVADRATDARRVLATLPSVVARLAPALVALETLAALALGWALYHRLARDRLGPPLAPLAAFRFHDQLVWGLVAGAACVAVPTLAALRDLGYNLVVFFGALYALRGVGVLCWLLGRRGIEIPLGVALVAAGLAFPVLGGALTALLAAAALALGLGDAWGGWRTRHTPA